jgi:hypothetical protein
MSTQRQLSRNELKDLKRCETMIHNSIKSFMDCGTALREIKEKKLYLQSHETFEDYIHERWGHSRSWAYQLIQVNECAQELPKVKIREIPSARAYHPLTNIVDKEVRDRVWTKAVAEAEEQGVAVSEAIVKRHVKEEVERKEPKPKLVDANGVRVPEKLRKGWTSKAYRLGQHHAGMVARAANMLPIGVGRRAEAIRLSDEIRQLFADVQPYAVCPGCGGQKCGWCNNQGYMAKHKLEDYQAKMEGKA